MAVAFVAQGAQGTASGTTVTIAPPANSSGQLMLLHFSGVRGVTISSISESGWTKIVAVGTGTGSDANVSTEIWYKFAAGSTANITLTLSAAYESRSVVTTWSGVSQADPISPYSTTTSVTAVTAISLSGVTPRLTNGMLVAAIGVGSNGTPKTVSSDTGMIEHYDSSANWIQGSLYSESLAGTSATGTRAFTISAAAQWAGILFILNDAASDSSKVITSSSAAAATAYSNQRKIDRCQNGVLWAAFRPTEGTATDAVARFHYSLDNGITWSFSGDCNNGSGSTTQTYAPNFSFFIDQDDYCHVVLKDNSNGYIYYRRGTPNAGRTAWTWSAASIIFNTDTTGNYPDIVAHREGTGWMAHITLSRPNDNGSDVQHFRVSVSSTGTISTFAGVVLATNYGNFNHKYPSIDFNHTGDSKTVAGGTPHLYVAWSAGATRAGKGIRFKKATYSAGAWTWGTEREVDSGQYVGGSYFLNCLFDGTRVVIAGSLDGAVAGALCIYDRDTADTATTVQYRVSAGSTVNFNGSVSYDSLGDVYLLTQKPFSGTADLGYYKWTRATATLGSRVVVDSTVPDASTRSIGVSAKRGYSNQRIEFIYTDGASSPYNVVYGAITLNSPPALPTSLAVTSTSSDYTPVFSANVSDPDTTNQVKARFDIQKSDGTPIGTVDSANVVGSGTVTAEYLTALAIGTYRVRAKAIDQSAAESAYTTWVAFTINTAPGSPTIAGTQPAQMYRFNWTFSDADTGDTQTRSQGEVRRQSDSVVVYSWDISNNLQYHDVTASTFPINTYEWRVRTYDSLGAVGAWSAYDVFTISNSSNISVYWNGGWVSSSGKTVS